MRNTKIQFSLPTLHKETVFVWIIALISAGLFLRFPTKGLFQGVISAWAFLVLLPTLYIIIIRKESVRDYFLMKTPLHRSSVVTFIALLIGFVAVHILLDRISLFSYRLAVTIPAQALESFWFFLSFEALLIALFLSAYEFFFRGFTLHILEPYLGAHTFIGQAILVGIFFLFLTGFSASTLSMTLLALCAGYIAQRTRSLYYSYGFVVLAVLLTHTFIVSRITQ